MGNCGNCSRKFRGGDGRGRLSERAAAFDDPRRARTDAPYARKIIMEKFVCIHGHFYQPPRENPWLESVELQDSAAPWHDWNERITVECYAPNAAARILNGDGR